MAEKNNATCSICGKAYYKCLSCKGKGSSEPWKMHCCSSEHFKIYQVIHGVNTGVYTKDEAREKFKIIDLSDLNKLRDNIKKIVKDIIKEDKKIEKIEDQTAQKEIVAEVVAEPVIAESVVETPVSPYVSRRKKSFEKKDFE